MIGLDTPLSKLELYLEVLAFFYGQTTMNIPAITIRSVRAAGGSTPLIV